MNYLTVYNTWCKKVKDTALKKELQEIADQPKTIENKFFRDLQFGTGGLRGEIGVGSNCLNIYTIGRATQGLADYLRNTGGKTVAISYDSRINSELFAKHAACVLAENKIKVYLVKELMPTPFLSFATRYYRADAGIMITASHNPSKYNGYKVYGADGCQITDAAAKKITECIEKIDCFAVRAASFENSLEQNMIAYMDDAVEEAFLSAVSKQSVFPPQNLILTYSPLNGTGYRIIPKLLKRLGVKTIHLVKEQAYPDGHFPTCSYPNPEKPAAMQLGLKYAKETDSDLLLATDPDADRVGIAVKAKDGYRLMTGNEVGILLMDFLLSLRLQNGTLPKNAVVIKTIVTSKLAEKVAKKYNVTLINVLTGFKYIGEQITRLENNARADDFILGFEESYGYLSGSYVRDKDAVVASMLIVEMASYYKTKGLTLLDRMEQLYKEYGTYSHKLLNFEFAGADGAKKMADLLAGIRQNLPSAFAGKKVTNVIDYLTQTDFDLPKSNVLQFDLEDDAQVIIRPSGTEPQIKVYLTAAQTQEQNAVFFENVEAELKKLFQL